MRGIEYECPQVFVGLEKITRDFPCLSDYENEAMYDRGTHQGQSFCFFGMRRRSPVPAYGYLSMAEQQ